MGGALELKRGGPAPMTVGVARLYVLLAVLAVLCVALIGVSVQALGALLAAPA